jgi:hypothetical protein
MNNIHYPNSIINRITDDFLETFKQELENEVREESNMPDKPTYWNYYQWFDNTNGFDKALKTACELHNLNDLYDYRSNKGHEEADILGGQITELLYKRGIIEEGNIDDAYPIPFSYKPIEYTEEELEELLNEIDEVTETEEEEI